MKRLRGNVYGRGLALLLTLPSGCGDDDHAPVADLETDGITSEGEADGGDEARSGDTDEDVTEGEGLGLDLDGDGENGDASVAAPGDGGAMAVAEPGAPRVELLGPEHQNSPEEVHDEQLEVRCRIEDPVGGDSEVDPSTVSFELLSAEGESLQNLVGTRGDEPDVYEATFPVQNVESGRVTVRCGAAEDSAEAKVASAEASTFIDHGPLVEVVTPAPAEPKSALGAVAFEYQIAADELIAGDEGAVVGDVRLTVAGQEFELRAVEDDEGTYRATIDFADPELFEEVPSGVVQVAVSATNARGITHSERYEFVLDGRGPVIVIDAPKATSIIGGTVTLELEIEDEVSEVDWETLVVQLNDRSYPYDEDGPWDIDGDSVAFTFETAEVTGSVVQINLNVRVQDVAGNDSDGASALFYRDEQAPIISLDPPNFREFDDGKDPPECSVPFDPLGVAPANGERVLDLAQYRALVTDETNQASGQEVLYLAGTDPESVDLFVRRPDAPLVIDTTGDGTCDDVSEEGTRFQELTALKPEGHPLYSESGLPDVAPVVDDECVFVDRNVPKQLCDEEASDLNIVVEHWRPIAEQDTVYAVSPNRELECTGRRWELRSAGLEGYQGWVCLAVRALDNVGNRGVSAPIAVCLDNDQVDGAPSCHVDLAEQPPDCTDGCSLPKDYDPNGYFYVRR